MLCLTMFPIIGLGEPYIPRFGGVLQECGYFTWRVSDCEEKQMIRSKYIQLVFGTVFYTSIFQRRCPFVTKVPQGS